MFDRKWLPLFVLLVDCGGGRSNSSTPTPTTATLARLAITDAKTLFVVGDGTASSVAGESNPSARALVADNAATAKPGLYKITMDNKVLEVSQVCMDPTGKAADCTVTLKALRVHNAGPKHVVVIFGGQGSTEVMLTSKDDGAVYRATPLGEPTDLPGVRTLGKQAVQTDSAGNIYYASWTSFETRGVMRIAQNGGGYSGNQVTPATDRVEDFLVDADGNVLYSMVNSSGSVSNRIARADGGISFLPFSRALFWLGLDGHFYALEAESLPTMDVVSRLDIAGGVASVMVIGPTGAAAALASQGAGLLMSPGNTFPVVLGDRLFLVTGSLLQGVDSTHALGYRVLPCLVAPSGGGQPGSDVRYATASSQALWLSASTAASQAHGLVRVTDDTCNEVLPATGYDVMSFSVSEDDVAQFSALRLSDGVKVVGSVDASGTVSILDAGLPDASVVLERI